jgi:hypothetical protein
MLLILTSTGIMAAGESSEKSVKPNKQENQEKSGSEQMVGQVEDKILSGEIRPEAHKYQKEVDKYKKTLKQASEDTIDEITKYRKSIVELNKKKKELYKNLSGEAKDILKKEKELKKKLPPNSKDIIKDAIKDFKEEQKKREEAHNSNDSE